MAHPYKRTWNGCEKRAVYVHRAVAEKKLGRPLQTGEVVHHEDENKSNADESNVRVFASQRQHMLYHHYCRREAAGVGHLFDLETHLSVLG